MRTFLSLSFFLIVFISSNAQTITPAGPIGICPGSSVVLSVTGGSPTSYQWKLNGGNVGTDPTYTATLPGNYTVVINGGGPGNTLGPVQVNLNPVPTANFTFSPTGQCSNVPISFNNTSSGANSYSWNFGDPNSGSNNTSTAFGPSHQFVGSNGNNSQNFQVTLIVTNSFGCKDTVIRTVTNQQLPNGVLSDPLNNFNFCGSTGNVTLTVYDASAPAINSNYHINWGDATPSYNSTTAPVGITHNYGTGIFDITYSVTGTNGCIDVSHYNVYNITNPQIGAGIPANTQGCGPINVCFPINNFSTNDPSTIYKVDFGDGSPLVTYSHPPPSTVCHTYTTTSCGAPNNAFVFKIQAKNVCDSSEGQFSPIRVYTKPEAEFDINPNPGCINSPVTFLNTTIEGSNNSCSHSTLYTWDFGDGTPVVTALDNSSQTHTFTAAGTFTVTLTAQNGCGPSSASHVICISALPVPSFTINTTEGCSPLLVNTTNTSVTTNTCSGGLTYLWQVSYSSGFCGNTSDWSFTGGTNANSQNPSFSFVGTGTYTISLSIITPCGTFTANQSVVVKKKPMVNINPINDACIPSSVNPTATITNCGNQTPGISWSFPGGLPNSSTAANPGTIVYNTSGNYTVTLAVSNECGTTNATTPVVVHPTPVPTVPVDIVRCAGTSIGPLSFSSSIAGATFSWTNSNPGIGLAASGSSNTIPVFTTQNSSGVPITATITVTTSLNGCSGTASFNITVNPLPSLPVVVSPVNYCQNATATALSATASAGNSLLWYTSAAGGTGSSTAPIPVTTATGNFSYYVSQVNSSTSCEGPREMIVVNVNPSPNISGISHVNPTTCGTNSGSITLTGLSASIAYTVNYTFNGSPQTINLTANASGSIVIPNLAAGLYDNIHVTSLGCSSNDQGPVTLSDPSTPATPTTSGNSPICAGATLNLSASTTSPGTVTYQWTGPNGFASVGQNASVSNATVAAGGTYFVTATISGCTSLPASVAVTVNPTPALPVLGSNSPICTGDNLNLTSNTGFPGALTYSWTGPNSFSSNQANPSIPNVTVAASGTYSLTITATTGSCASPQATVAVTVNPTPHINNATATNPSTCSSSTGYITLTGLTPSQNFTIHYTYNVSPQTQLATADGSGNLVLSNLAAGTYDNIYVELNGCSSNQFGPYVLQDPTPPPTPVVSNGGPVCSGGSVTLSSSAAPVGATYNWSGPGSYSSGQQNPVLTPVALSNAGVYSLYVVVNGCSSATATTTLVVNETPAMPVASNDGPVCTGNTLNLSASTTFTGAVTFTWTGPNVFSSSQQNPSINNVTVQAAGTYSVTAIAQTGNCVSQTATTVVVVNTTPQIINATSVNPSSCSSATGSITLNGLSSGNTYSVAYLQDGNPQSATITANGTGQVIISNLVAGVYDNIQVSIAGCPSNIVGPYTLSDPNPPAPPLAGSNSAICLGATLTLSASSSATGTITYSWTGPNSFSSNLQNPSISNTITSNAGMYYVHITVNNCTSLNDSVLVVINPLGNLPVAPSPVSYCINETATALTASNDPNNTLNWYATSAGGTALATAPVPVTTVAGSVFYYVSQTTALGCEGPRTAIEVITHPDAKAFFDPTDTIGCPQFQLTPAIINLQLFPANNSDYEWYANGVLIGTGPVFPGYTIINENDVVTIKLKAISLFGCRNDSISRNFYTYNLPHPSFTMSDSVGCGPLSVTFTNTTPNIGLFNYAWDFGNSTTSTLAQPGTIVFQSNPTYNDTVYVIKLKVLSICDTLIFSDSVRVKSKPRALYTPSSTNGCSPMSVLFTNTSGGNNNTYTWNFDDGTIVTTNSSDTFTHVFHTGVVDTFHVQLLAVNECGADSIMYNIIAAPNNIHLNYSFNGTDAAGCAPHTVAFINNTTGGSLFNWNFGDGNSQTTTDNIDTVYHTFTDPGVYSVSVHAFNNCTDTIAIKYITVYPTPVASFIASQLNSCIGQTIQFTNQSDSSNAWEWHFGDGALSSLENPAHTYTNPGLFTVTLISYHNNPDGSSCIDSTHASIQVSSTLPGNISLSANTGNCVPFTITFVNHDIPSVSSTWDFGDGNGATGDSVLHTYTTPGTYTVTSTVTAPGGCVYNNMQVVTITGPSGSLLYTGGFVCYPDPVRFEAVATGTNNLVWNFGDGNTLSTNQLVVYHTYNNPGTYIPSVTLQSTGCDFTSNGPDTIKVDKTDAGFNITEQQYCGYSNILFTDTSHVFFGEASVEWDFGDGNNGTGNIVNHQYTVSGPYTIMMIVTGISGCKDTVYKQLNLHINNIPVSSITGPATGCVHDIVNFQSNIQSTDPLNITHWTLSNGATGDNSIFSYQFETAGNYSLQLITGTVNGCRDTTYHSIVINPVPVVHSSGDLTLCLGGSAQLTATGPSPLQWTPVQGLSCTNCPNPIATPSITTPYIVSGTNSFGCSGYDTTVITVIQPLHLSVSPDDSICIGQSANLLVSGGTSYQWSPPTGLNNTSIPNPVASPTTTIRYRVVGYDGYNCFTDTAYVLVAVGQYPSIDLGPDLTLATGTMHPLTSVITNGPITQWLWEPATDLSCSDCNIPIAEVKHDITYKVTGTTAYGCSATDDIRIKVFCLDAQVFIPNAFTPNSDGKNDVLMVRGKGIVSVQYFRIFNRWGEVVFERNNFPPNNPTYGWDGKIKGKFSPPGVFVYTAGVICENGTPYEYKGNVTIIK
ncbi:MAG: PKD domain-containing protein [Bacteroidetes bacterium]|nr:PKD domain-containing protein [Bacteroidota bacterium]